MNQQKEKVAVIDIGSNSIRLVIHELDAKRGAREIHNLKKSARLSNYIDEHNCLTTEGFTILLQSLQQLEEVIEYHQVKNVKAVATAAIRNASNREKILSYIHKETSLTVRVLTEAEEARYGYLAVVNSTYVTDGITIDIGGGSTEITLFQNRELLYSHSFPFGALTLKKQFFPDSEPEKNDIQQLLTFIHQQFAALPWLKQTANLPVVGIGGSARNMSLVHQAQMNYALSGLHQYTMTPQDVKATLALFEKLSLKEREELDGLSKDRADVIIPAAAVIYQLIDYVHANYFLMSHKGLRDGLLFEEVLRDTSQQYFPSVAEESFFQLSREFEINEHDVKAVGAIAGSLYQSLVPYLPSSLKKENNLYLLEQSARVLYMGEFINHEASSQHTFYVLTNRSIDGISHQNRLALASIASFKSKSWFKRLIRPFRSMLTKQELKRYELLGSILKLSYSLDRTKRRVVEHIAVEKQNRGLSVYIYCRNHVSFHFEELKSKKYKKHIEKVIKKPVHLYFLYTNFTKN
ncbi:exopolyphosphatase / guanosine-5'-triphosphate,3'-diphosphate pyrophosphatase [Alteribacillus persepolensis]|uniref:exopolyphosphatase n=1 Tax=Alteribacillus persepolensis TaxID=568899 RepID=A0A1G8CU39_9BACI|nr:exopolyphosphatase [Alteribacillus persepolensis]SDH48774.1 exopolyphosphatase / guanosine-5'-triphosphate,3'-diphosphate pyrophosphatase [Alteribacillus persepolensis]